MGKIAVDVRTLEFDLSAADVRRPVSYWKRSCRRTWRGCEL